MLSRRYLTIALIAVLSLMAAVKFTRQDISSTSVPTISDFVSIYVAGNAWLHGSQPYMQQSIDQETVRVYGADNVNGFDVPITYYPPTTFVAVLPFLLLPHQVVIAAVFLVSIFSYIWLIWLLATDLTGLSRYLFLAFSIDYAPFHSGLRPTNVTVIMAALICIPLITAIRNKMSSPWWFVVLGLGVAIKPQLGVLFLLVPALRREWKRFFVAVFAVTASVISSVGWLALHRIHWLTAFWGNLRGELSTTAQNASGTMSFVVDGVANFRLINLSPAVYLVSGNLKLSNILPFVLAAALLLCFVVLLWRAKYRLECAADWIPIIGVFGAISLLPVYSHYYGAIFILPLFAWLWKQWHRPVLRGFLLAGAILFSLPMPQLPIIWLGAVEYFQHRGMGLSKASSIITNANFGAIHPSQWQEVLCALPNLFLLAICVLLLIIIVRRTISDKSKSYTGKRELWNETLA